MLTQKTAAELHIEIRAQRDAFAQKLTNALTAADFIVESKLSTEDWGTSVLTVKSKLAKEFEVYATFEIRSKGCWSYSNPSHVRLTFALGGGYWQGKTRYQKLNDALVTSLVEKAKVHLKNVTTGLERQAEALSDAQRWAAVRAEQLAGLVVPPGTSIMIMNGTGPDAGKYHVRFEAYHHNSIQDTAMTPEQIRKLVAVLNEIQGTEAGWVIRGTLKGSCQRYYYTSGGFWNNEGPKVYPSQEAAQADVKRATDLRDSATSVEVAPYASVAVI